MAGTLTISTLSDGTNSTSSTNCIQGSAKAWVNFNGSGGAIRGSYNVSSITVNATGDYTINFTSALANTNYCFQGSTYAGVGAEGSIVVQNYLTSPTTSAFRILVGVPGTNGATALTPRNEIYIYATFW